MTAQDIAAALIAAPRLTYDSLEPLREPPGVVQHRTRGGKGPVGRLHDRKAHAAPEVYVVRRRA